MKRELRLSIGMKKVKAFGSWLESLGEAQTPLAMNYSICAYPVNTLRRKRA